MIPNTSTKHTPMKFEASYVFSDTINRIDNILTDIQKIKLINSKSQIPFIFTRIFYRAKRKNYLYEFHFYE